MRVLKLSCPILHFRLSCWSAVLRSRKKICRLCETFGRSVSQWRLKVVAEMFGELADTWTTRKEMTLLEIVTDLGTCASVSVWKCNGQGYNFWEILVNSSLPLTSQLVKENLSSLTLYSAVVAICTAKFNIQQTTKCICVFCMDLRTNSDYFPIQH